MMTDENLRALIDKELPIIRLPLQDFLGHTAVKIEAWVEKLIQRDVNRVELHNLIMTELKTLTGATINVLRKNIENTVHDE